MKIMKYLLSAFAVLALAVACNHDPDEMVINPTTPAIAPHNEVVVNDLTVNETFTLVWSSARVDDAEYMVYVKRDGAYINLGSTTECSYSISNAELLSLMDIKLTGEYALTFYVEACSAEGKLTSKEQVVKFNYSKITYLYILGAYQGWTENSECSRLLQGSDGVFRGFLHLENADQSEFKIVSQPYWDGTEYGPAEEEGKLFVESAEGAPANFKKEAGLYYIEVNVDELSYVMLPLTSVSLIGDAFGEPAWDHDVPLYYNATDKTWTGIANVTPDKEYKVRFNNAWDVEGYNCSLGESAEELVIASNNNLRTGEVSGLTGFTLSLYDYPYTIKTGAVSEDESKLYVVNSTDEWNYSKGVAMQAITNENGLTGSFWGLNALPTAASDAQIVLSRLQTDLATRFGGDAAAMTKYAAGEEATPMATNAGMTLLHADLNAMKLTQLAVSKVGAVGDFNGWDAGNSVQFSPVEEGKTDKWVLEHDFSKDGSMLIIFDNQWNKVVDGVEFQTKLGGSCTNLQINGSNLVMTKGMHKLELDLTTMTLAIDGAVKDLSLSPDFLEITGAFGAYNWNLGAASPQLRYAHENRGDVDKSRFVGFVDMYAPEGATGTDAEFKVTYPNWSAWLGGVLREGTTYVYDIATSFGDNIKQPYGLYYWDVALNATDQVGVATVVPIGSVNVIGAVNDTQWSQDFPLEAKGNGIYSAEMKISGEFKIRCHEVGWTAGDTDWKYNLSGKGESVVTVELGTAVECGVDEANFKVAAEGNYLVEVNMGVSPATVKLTAK